MAHRLEESATLLQVHQGPSQIICARYDKFARDHSDALSNALGDGCQSALCLSLACFEYITGATVWACLFRHDNADVIGIERSIRCYFQSPSVRATLEPLDPDAVVFRYAILPGLRFGPRVSKTGKVLVGRETGGPGKLTSAGDALYSSGDLIDANSTATIGGVVKAWKEDRGWSTFGITIAIPLEGVRDPEALPSTLPQFPERRPTSPSTLPKSRIHRGVSEICVSLTTNPGEPAKRLTVDAYKNRGHGFAQALSCQITNSTTSDAWKGVPWCLIEFGQGISTLAADPTKIHGHITAGIDEPKTDDELIILRKTEHLLRCVVLEPTAWIRPPGPAKFFPARKLRLTLNHSLNPWDIGALVVQETDTHFKAHYQIVALAGSNEAYAVSIRGLIHSLTDAGYTEVAFVSDIDGVGNEASPLPGAPNRDNTAQLVLHPSLIAQPDELSFRNSNLPLVSLGATLDRVPQHSQRVPKAVRSFRNAVQSYTLRNYLNQEFVLIEHLDRWMQKRSTDKARPDNTWLVLLLVDSYELHGGIDNYPSLTRIRHDIKLSSTRSLFRLFCVLLQINAGHLIEALSYFLSDNDLPLTKESLETELTTRRILSSVADAQNLASRFVAEQYFFCPKCLLSRKLTKFNPDEIVPVTRMEPVNDKEQVANVYHIEIPSDYVSPAVQELATAAHRFETDGIPYYEFAVKSFNDASDFHDELSNFVSVQDISSIVQCFSYYEVHSSPQTHGRSRCQYNVVLELGRYDLNQLIRAEKSPVLFRDVFEVWDSLGSVIDALCQLHTRMALTEKDGITIQGWHADLKPDNILRVGDVWKLADLGFSKFKLNLGKSLGRSDFIGGTVTYGAPETFSRTADETVITPLIDIWSLGCVLSTVATWVVLGSPSVAHFRRVRQAAIHSLMAQPSNYELFTGDYFHNGHDVLPEVTAWHDFLRYSLRRSDPLTGKILDIVDHFMLKGDTRDRHNAAEVNRDYKQCLDQCLAEASHAEFEPPGDLWSNHRNIIALAEQEASDDELVVSQHFSALSRTQRSPRSPPSSPQQHPQSRTWPMAHQEKLALEPSRQPQERSSASTDEGVRETAPDKPRQQSVVRFKSAQEDAIGQRYNMTWARKSLRLDEPRFRSPTRSLLRSAAKKVGVKQKSGLDSNVLTSSLASFYKDRSLVFLVDSGTSMREHWSEATTLLETLLTLAKGVGNLRAIDLRFTSQRNISVNQERNVRQFMRAMMAARPKSDVQAVNTKEKMQVLGSLKTDMAATLSALFAEYKEKIRRSRGFTIIVLTDGMWAPGDPGAVQQEISKFADQFGRPYPRHRPFNIEFVWFGHAGEQAKKLTELDGQTKDSRNLGPIVDTENSDGSVHKMLVGSSAEGSDSEKREALRTPFPMEDEPFDPDSD